MPGSDKARWAKLVGQTDDPYLGIPIQYTGPQGRVELAAAPDARSQEQAEAQRHPRPEAAEQIMLADEDDTAPRAQAAPQPAPPAVDNDLPSAELVTDDEPTAAVAPLDDAPEIVVPIELLTAPMPLLVEAGSTPVHTSRPVTGDPSQPTAVLDDVAPLVAPQGPERPVVEAPPVHHGYLLLEHPAPWAADVLDSESIPEALRLRLRAWSSRHNMEVVLARRPDGGCSPTGPVLMLSVPDNDGLLIWRVLSSIDALGAVDLDDAVKAARDCVVPTGWTEGDPVMAVGCGSSTSQRTRGPAVASSLATLDPDNAWETSHQPPLFGGVSVLVLPANLIYGPIDPADSPAVVDAAWQGRLLVDRLLGRSHLPAPQQAAEVALRQRLRADTNEAVKPLDARDEQIAIGGGDDSGISVNRVITRWRVFPRMISDPTLARMAPSLRAQTSRIWRVVVDIASSVEGCDPGSVSVIEVADEDEPGHSAHTWDARHHADQGPVPLPDPTVVAETGTLPPGTALDLGCGSGRHAIWLAERGWRVTGVDFSRAGLWRMADEAGRRKVGIRGELADLRLWTPAAGSYDLVLVAFVHIEDVFARAARWLAPGGRVVVIGHAVRNATEGVGGPNDRTLLHDYVYLAARATGARLRVLRAGEVERQTPDGVAIDSVIVATKPA